MKKITVDEIMKLDPCYSKYKVSTLIGGGKTPIEILDLDIPKQDKFWLLLRKDYIPEKNLHLLACEFAQQVAYLNPDPRVQSAIDAKKLWLDGKITTEALWAARFAARAAVWTAYDSRSYVTSSAAYHAADAADSAAYASRDTVDTEAVWAARAAVSAVANIENQQLEAVRKVLIEMEKIK